MTVDEQGEPIGYDDYYPFGLTMPGRSSNTGNPNDNYKFTGHERDDEANLTLDYMGARNYDPVLGRFLQVDPLVSEFPNISPYAYGNNSPLFYTDPTGMAPMNPIYDRDGNFLGTDNRGLQGKAIVMEKENFTQGMSHEKAASKSLGVDGLNSYQAGSKLLNHKSGLKNRPDWDGYVTREKGIDWAKSNPGALQNPTSDNMLYIDASKLNFGNLSTSNFTTIGTPEAQNLLNAENMVASLFNKTLESTVYALGRVDMVLNNRISGNVSIVNNAATNYDWNTGGRFLRNSLVKREMTKFGLNKNHGFKTYYYGTGTLNN